MTLTDRDKKLVLVLLPVALLMAYWFLVLAPKRDEAATLGTQLTQVETERDEAQALASEAQRSKGTYARDYATVVRLGKAIPSEVDMPSLIVQLDEAARDTDIRFVKVATGDREAAPPAPAPPAEGEGEAEPPAAEAGGEPASTDSGEAVEQANETAGTAPTTGAATTSGAPGLESVPLSFSFQGSFFDLADFFHEMKRFVRIAGDGVRVNGRLMTIDGFTFSSETFPTITAEVEASVYLSPQDEGTAAGATPAGPATAPAAGAPAPAAPAPAPAPPVATAGAIR